MKWLLFLILVVNACKSKSVDVPPKFIGVWSNIENPNIRLDVSQEEDRCVVTQHYADRSGSNTPNGGYYDEAKDVIILPAPRNEKITLSIIKRNGQEILHLEGFSNNEEYTRSGTNEVPWRR